MAKPRQVSYYDPDGKEQTGWEQGGHVYTDEAATKPIPVGSTVRTANGRVFRQTRYGGVLWSSPTQTDRDGAWIPQGNPWYREAQDLLIRQQNRPAFSYDPEQDVFWQSAKDQYLRQGQKAMEDTLGRASALTGGYASSYAQNLGQQSYRESLGELGKLLPELYDRAKASYDSETKRLLDQIDTALGLYDSDYQNYLDAMAARERQAAFDRAGEQWQAAFDRDSAQWAQELAWEQERWNRDFDRDNAQWQAEFNRDNARWQADRDRWAQELAWEQEQWNRNFDRDNAQWQADFDRDNDQWQADFDRDNDHWEREFAEDSQRWRSQAEQERQEWNDRQRASADSAAASAAEKERSYAYRMAMLALQQGLPVSPELLAAAGIDPAYAEQLRRHYAAQQNKP